MPWTVVDKEGDADRPRRLAWTWFIGEFEAVIGVDLSGSEA